MRHVVRIVTMACALSSAAAAAQEPAPGRERIRRAQLALASSLGPGPGLPDVPVAVWLRHVLGTAARYQWTSGSCPGMREPDQPAVALCGIVAAAGSEVTVTVGIRLGEYLQDAGVDRWGTPQLDGAFVSRAGRVVMLDRLGDLPRILDLPPERWPRADVGLESVYCLPERAQPDDDVTCALVLENRGDAPSLARVFLDVGSDRSLGGDGLVKLQPGQRRTVRMMFSWPDADGAAITAGVELADRPPYSPVHDYAGLALPRGDDLDTPAELVGWDDDGAAEIIVSARAPIRGTAHTLDLPVDGSVSRLLVSVEALPGITATLLRPGGVGVGAMDGDLVLSELKTMDLQREIPANIRLYAIARPQPGVWQLDIAASPAAAGSAVLVKAIGYSSIRFGRFEFVRKQEGVHGGYFGVDGLPLAGGPATVLARLWNGPQEPTFRLVDEAGAELQTLALRKGPPDAAADEFLGMFEPPAVPFQVVMNAVDASGATIQRQYPATFRAQPVALFFNPGTSDAFEPGTSRRFTFAVTNVGSETATFALHVTTTLGEVTDLSAATVTVEPGASATPSFWLTVPAAAHRPGSLRHRMTATETRDASVTNSASAELELSQPGDADNDYVPDALDNCRDVPNHDQADTNRNGIGDVCDAMDGGPLSIRGLSPQSGPPGTVVRIAGAGFSPSGLNGVLFNGTPAAAVAVNASELLVTVPADVAIGPVLLMVGSEQGVAMAPMPFVVRRPASAR